MYVNYSGNQLMLAEVCGQLKAIQKMQVAILKDVF